MLNFLLEKRGVKSKNILLLCVFFMVACEQVENKKTVVEPEQKQVEPQPFLAKPEKNNTSNKESEVVTMPPASAYEQQDVLGWKVMVSPNVKSNPQLYEPIFVQLKVDLAKVHSVVPVEAVKDLQKTTIWLEQGMPKKQLNTTFFNGGRALTKKHGLVPESYGGVIIGNTKGYLRVAGIKPWQMLHELTHAFHQFELKHDYQPVKYAYNEAMNDKRFHPKGDKRIPRKAYATKNQKEYLSELTVMYFGEKRVYPRNRDELAEHDPIGYCAIVQAWGLVDNQQGDVPLYCNSAK